MTRVLPSPPATLLAAPFAVLAFMLRFGGILWVQPLTWRLDPWPGGLLAYLGVLAVSGGVPVGGWLLLTRAARRRRVVAVLVDLNVCRSDRTTQPRHVQHPRA